MDNPGMSAESARKRTELSSQYYKEVMFNINKKIYDDSGEGLSETTIEVPSNLSEQLMKELIEKGGFSVVLEQKEDIQSKEIFESKLTIKW